MCVCCGDERPRLVPATQELSLGLAILLLLALDQLLGAELELVRRQAEDVHRLAPLPGQVPRDLGLVITGRKRELEPLGLPRQSLAVQPDPGVGVARGGVHPRVVGIVAFGLRPCVVGLPVASEAQQQIGDQRLRAGMIVELAVPAGGDRLSHRVDRLVEPAELLVGVGEFVEIPRAVRLRTWGSASAVVISRT